MNDDLNPEHNPLFKEEWYHRIELKPGFFTPGANYDNIAVTRELLRGCDFRGTTCLDVGAMDFLVSLLMLRRNAKQVVAYDRLDLSRREQLIKKTFGVDFTYVNGFPLTQLPVAMKRIGVPSFDVVVFSGVLYHMLDPLSGLCTARGLVRNGGLLVIETAGILDDSIAMFFNAEGRFYKWTNYWQISVGCLEYLLRFLKLKVLNCLYLLHSRRTNLIRIGVVCRAVDHCIIGQRDEWMVKEKTGLFDEDFAEFLDWKAVQQNGRPDVPYSVSNRKLLTRPDTRTVDLFRTFKKQGPIKVTSVGDQICLKLDASY